MTSTVTSGELPLPLTFTDAVKHCMLDTDSGLFQDPRNGEIMKIESALNMGLIHPRSAIFKDPLIKQNYDLKEAIEKMILEPTGFYFIILYYISLFVNLYFKKKFRIYL
jgi:hypothetical protein